MAEDQIRFSVSVVALEITRDMECETNKVRQENRTFSAQAGPTAAKVSASINPHRVMIAFTSEQRMPQQTSSWLSKLSREAVSTVETGRDGTRKAIFAVGKRNFPGQSQRPRNAPCNPIGRLQRQNTFTNRRQFGAICTEPGNPVCAGLRGGAPGRTDTSVDFVEAFPKCDNSGSIKPQRESLSAVAPRLKYLHCFTDRHGKPRHYFRHRGQRWSIPAPGTEGFAVAYDRLIEQISAKKRIHGGCTHGKSKTRVYAVWVSMIQRCNNPKNPNWKNYGGRGIAVCDRWRESFEAFYADIGPKPGAGYSIDRIDNNGNYEPGSCRWATHIEQAANRRERRPRAESGKPGRTP